MGLTSCPAVPHSQVNTSPGLESWSLCGRHVFVQKKRPIRQLTKSTPPTIWQEISAMNETDQLMDVDGNCSTSNWKKSNGDFPLAMIYLVKPQH